LIDFVYSAFLSLLLETVQFIGSEAKQFFRLFINIQVDDTNVLTDKAKTLTN
jgi:hypothetical protein